MCLVDSKKINEEELQELFPEGMCHSLYVSCFCFFCIFCMLASVQGGPKK